MKKLLCIVLTLALVFSTTVTAEAKKEKAKDPHGKNGYHTCAEIWKEYFISKLPVIKTGKYKIPIKLIEEEMKASANFNKKKNQLTVSKGKTKIVIDFRKKTAAINGIKDKNSSIFTAKNSLKLVTLVKYIAGILGYTVEVSGDVIVIKPVGQRLDAPYNVTVTPVGAVVLANTLNSTTTHLNASASITPGQATGGRAELYVGNRLVAVDSSINATDNSVTFTTSDGSPTNTELQTIIPTGGIVSVKLYNAYGSCATSSVANPVLHVDYVSPTLTGITSATYDISKSKLSITVTGASSHGDTVDVTKLSLYDVALGRTWQLTSSQCNGSIGTVSGPTSLSINIGSTDRTGLAGFGSSLVYLTIASGSLLKDAAGNTSPAILAPITVPVTIVNYPSALNPPTNITLSPYGTVTVANTLNSTTQYLYAYANITAGQAAGGRAELYVGGKLVATDTSISVTDTLVTFNTSDGSPTNAELQTLIPAGGVVTVKLYNKNNQSVTSSVGNPTLIVDYVSPTLTKLTSAIFDTVNSRIYLYAEGAGAIGDMVDVTKLLLFDSATGKICQLTDSKDKESSGSVISANLLTVNLGSTDKANLSGFGKGTVYLTIFPGSLIRDTSGNTSPYITDIMSVPVSVIK